MIKIGFLPCFSCYLHKHFPLQDFYQNPSYIRRVKALLSALVDSKSPYVLKQNIGQEVKPVRPDNKDGKALVKLCGFDYSLYRIDYGNNPFRIVFGYSNINRMAFIYIIDTKHKTLRGKHK